MMEKETLKFTTENPLTLEDLKSMEPGIFATGFAIDNSDELFMNNTGNELRWVAVRGGIHDWAMYCHYSYHNPEYIRDFGEKVTFESNIKRFVPCDKEAFDMYRY